jgi:type II secretory pathway component PulK
VTLEVTKKGRDGSSQVYTAHPYKDGFYRVEVKVRELSEVKKLADQGNSVRMKSGTTGKFNLMNTVVKRTVK